jgi:hypothetical protein
MRKYARENYFFEKNLLGGKSQIEGLNSIQNSYEKEERRKQNRTAKQ